MTELQSAFSCSFIVFGKQFLSAEAGVQNVKTLIVNPFTVHNNQRFQEGKRK